jgi:chromosomal replication initiation ATPase DnaA
MMTNSSEQLASYASELSGFSVADFKSSSRTQRLTMWRTSLFYVLRHEGLTFAEIGAYFNRHTSTIIHGCNKIEGLKHDKELHQIINQLIKYYGNTNNK